MAAVMASMEQMFPVEPLTDAELARLPAATELIETIIPPGTMGEMMGSMMDGVLAPIMEMAIDDPSSVLSDQLGIDAVSLGLDEAQIAEIATMLDPDWQERKARESAMLPEVMNTMMSAMEPGMKVAMAEMYAVYFDEQELAEISAFFATETGTAYARKSFTMSADPRLIGSMMRSMPAMMETFGQIEARIAEATADLVTPRTFVDLAPEEQAVLSSMTGMSVEELAASSAESSPQAGH